MILLIENEDFNAQFIQRALRQRHQVVWCKTRGEVLNKLVSLPAGSIHLVVADREIGGSDGAAQEALTLSNDSLQLLKSIRSHPVLSPSASIIVWSGLESAQSVDQVRRSTLVDGFLAKSRMSNIAEDLDRMVAAILAMREGNLTNQPAWVEWL